MHDGVQTSQTSKFVHALWRPLTAIRRADQDMNAATTADTGWSPLLTTPPYPSYAGNLACPGASVAEALGLVFGSNDNPFAVVWFDRSGNPDVAGPYSGFRELAVDQADSRIWGGIHYRFDSDASQDVCRKVAQLAQSRHMRPRWHHQVRFGSSHPVMLRRCLLDTSGQSSGLRTALPPLFSTCV